MNTKSKNLILLILLWSMNILAAESNIQSSFFKSDTDLSVYSENILISAVENIRQKKIEKALELLKE